MACSHFTDMTDTRMSDHSGWTVWQLPVYQSRVEGVPTTVERRGSPGDRMSQMTVAGSGLPSLPFCHHLLQPLCHSTSSSHSSSPPFSHLDPSRHLNLVCIVVRLSSGHAHPHVDLANACKGSSVLWRSVPFIAQCFRSCLGPALVIQFPSSCCDWCKCISQVTARSCWG